MIAVNASVDPEPAAPTPIKASPTLTDKWAMTIGTRLFEVLA